MGDVFAAFARNVGLLNPTAAVRLRSAGELLITAAIRKRFIRSRQAAYSVCAIELAASIAPSGIRSGGAFIGSSRIPSTGTGPAW